MKDRLLGLLSIESGEESMVSVLLMQSVFLGIFFGTFDISAHSLFLSVFDEKMMARGYVLSGLAGIILTLIYTNLQTRMIFRNFAIINLIFVTLFTLFLWILLLVTPSKWVTFLVFIMLGPLNILALLGFWGTAGRLFTLRQGKRLFGLVDSGLLVGIIISCYAIPVLLSFNLQAHNILLVSALAVLMGSLIQIFTGARFNFAGEHTEKDREVHSERKPLMKIFRQDPYIRIMALFIIFSVMTAFFIQYSFMAVTREQYPSEEDMARFLGLFIGSMMIFTLLVKVLVFSYLIRNYGLRTCLAISPVLVAGFTLIAIIIGMLMGYTPATSGFMLFFMLLALSRLFSKALKDSIESPSFKVIYQTIDEKSRYKIQSGMDGTVNEISALTSGLLLAGLGVISFIELIHFSWVLFIITIIWIFVAVKLYAEYRKSIRKALEPGDILSDDETVYSDKVVLRNKLSAKIAFQNSYFDLISGNADISDKYKSESYLNKLLEYSESSGDFCLLPVIKRMTSDKELSREITQKATLIAESLQLGQSFSDGSEDKLLNTRRILAGSNAPQTTHLLRLLRDKSPESKKMALLLIGKFRITEMLPEVCSCLNVKGLEVTASSVLRSFGKEAFDELTRFFMISSGNRDTSNTILRLLGTDCNNGSEEFLLLRLWSGSRQLRETALKSLLDSDFKPTEEEKERLHQLISDTAGIMVWNISSRIVLQRKNDPLLLSALEKEFIRWNSFLFGILALTYEAASVSRIRENLESGTVEGVNYALEMVDIVIDDSIKPKLIPLLDIIPDEERYRNLYHFFPGEIPRFQDLVVSILNRDYNLLGIWIRASVLRSITRIESPEQTESIVALLFSPNKILQEEATLLIARSDPGIYSSVYERIPGDRKNHLDEVTRGRVADANLLYEKVRFLASVIPAIAEEELIQLAEALVYPEGMKLPELTPGTGCILWKVRTNPYTVEVKIIDKPDELTLGLPKRDQDEYFYLLSFDAVEEFHYRFPELSHEMIKYIENNQTQ
jgi:ATP/ADP translocase